MCKISAGGATGIYRPKSIGRDAGRPPLKYSLPYLLLTIAFVGAMLGLEWFETHGGPQIIPPRGIIFAIVVFPSLISAVYALSRCRPRKKAAS